MRLLNRDFGRSERIRTSDPLLPKQVRYQTALRSDRGGDLRPDRAKCKGASAPHPGDKPRQIAGFGAAFVPADGAVLRNLAGAFTQHDIDARCDDDG